MEYRYAEHPEGSVANIEKFLPERKKSGSERKGGRKGRDRREGVIESFAFLENIIDRLELIGARQLAGTDGRSFAFARIHAVSVASRRVVPSREKPLIGRRGAREFSLEFILTTICVLLQSSI